MGERSRVKMRGSRGQSGAGGAAEEMPACPPTFEELRTVQNCPTVSLPPEKSNLGRVWQLPPTLMSCSSFNLFFYQRVRIKAQLLKQDNVARRRGSAAHISVGSRERPAAHTKLGPAVNAAGGKTAGLSWMREEPDGVSDEELLPYFSHELLALVGLVSIIPTPMLVLVLIETSVVGSILQIYIFIYWICIY